MQNFCVFSPFFGVSRDPSVPPPGMEEPGGSRGGFSGVPGPPPPPWERPQPQSGPGGPELEFVDLDEFLREHGLPPPSPPGTPGTGIGGEKREFGEGEMGIWGGKPGIWGERGNWGGVNGNLGMGIICGGGLWGFGGVPREGGGGWTIPPRPFRPRPSMCSRGGGGCSPNRDKTSPHIAI